VNGCENEADREQERVKRASHGTMEEIRNEELHYD
jgi:hypothetical protein